MRCIWLGIFLFENKSACDKKLKHRVETKRYNRNPILKQTSYQTNVLLRSPPQRNVKKIHLCIEVKVIEGAMTSLGLPNIACHSNLLSKNRLKNWKRYIFLKTKLLAFWNLVWWPRINILCAAFTCEDSKSAKKSWQFDCLFALLGSARVKVARKYVGEIDT